MFNTNKTTHFHMNEGLCLYCARSIAVIKLSQDSAYCRARAFFNEGYKYAEQENGYLAGQGLEPKYPESSDTPAFNNGYQAFHDQPDEPKESEE